MTSASHRIVIVGGGASGALVAAQLLRQAETATEITIIERNPPTGAGLAYRTHSANHLLNVPAARMSAWPDDPEHFLRWAQSRAGSLGLPSPVAGDEFLSRGAYGHYLNEVFVEARLRAGPGVTCEVLQGEAIDLEETAAGARLTLGDGSTLNADQVVLALGILPGEYPIRRSLPIYHTPYYAHVPWVRNVLDGVGPDDDILVIGAGLTAVDLIVQYRASGHRGVVHALSRHGLRPQAHRAGLAPYPPFLTAGSLPATAAEALARVREEVSNAAERGLDWRPVIDSIRPCVQSLWQHWSWKERARFLRHLRPFWETHRHRIAPAVAAAVQALESEGKLRFHAGRLTSLRSSPEGASAVIKMRGREDFVAIRVAKVINCTGPRTDYSKYQHPLLINLLAAGLITHDPLALGLNALPTGEVLRYSGNPVGWLYTIGAPLKGILWESTALPEIRVQAQGIAQAIIGGKSRSDRAGP